MLEDLMIEYRITIPRGNLSPTSGVDFDLCVVGVRAINKALDDLEDWQKTDDYMNSYLKVIEPENYVPPYIEKKRWMVCKEEFGARTLTFDEYVDLVKKYMPNFPLNKNTSKLSKTK